VNHPVIYVDVYQNRVTRQWRWRAKSAGNQRAMANGGESYRNYADCVAAVQQLFGPSTVVYRREAEKSNELVRHPEQWPAT
jgi:hypothetical protein